MQGSRYNANMCDQKPDAWHYERMWEMAAPMFEQIRRVAEQAWRNSNERHIVRVGFELPGEGRNVRRFSMGVAILRSAEDASLLCSALRASFMHCRVETSDMTASRRDDPGGYEGLKRRCEREALAEPRYHEIASEAMVLARRLGIRLDWLAPATAGDDGAVGQGREPPLTETDTEDSAEAAPPALKPDSDKEGPASDQCPEGPSVGTTAQLAKGEVTGADGKQNNRTCSDSPLFAGAAPLTEPSHSPDFTSVNWFGTQYTFAKGNQAGSVRVLWAAWESGGHSLSQEEIGDQIGSMAHRFELAKVFRKKRPGGGYEYHPAWGTMIRQASKGSYRLATPESA